MNPYSKQHTYLWLKKHGIKNYSLHMIRNGSNEPTCCVDVNGDVTLSGNDLRSIDVLFRKVKGNFTVCFNDDDAPSSLLNMPEEVHGDLSISGTSLVFLKGCPRYIWGNVKIEKTSIISLDGGPEIVGGDLSIVNCRSLNSLKGAPKRIKGDITLLNTKIRSLSGLPKEVNHLIVSSTSLRSLNGSPETIHGNLTITGSPNLKSLKGGPTYVTGDVRIIDANLAQLTNTPYCVGGNFSVCYSKIKSLHCEHMEVHGDFDVSCNELTSLAGSPYYVGGSYEANSCNIHHINDLECEIKKDLRLDGNTPIQSAVSLYSPKARIGSAITVVDTIFGIDQCALYVKQADISHTVAKKSAEPFPFGV